MRETNIFLCHSKCIKDIREVLIIVSAMEKMMTAENKKKKTRVEIFILDELFVYQNAN